MTISRTLTHHGELEAPDGAPVLVTVNVTATGPVAIWATERAHAELTGSDGGHPRSRLEAPVRAVIAVYLDSPVPLSTIPVKLRLAHPHVDELPDGSLLVVGARSTWRRRRGEKNARIFDREGRVLAKGCLGDGIEHVRVDENGDIWVGYFDEGVFGNRGWGGPGPEPLGAPGIVKWSRRFQKLWGASDSRIVDCYALTVASGSIWAATYTDFPLRYIRDGAMTTTNPTGVDTPRGVVVSPEKGGYTVGLIGTYEDALQVMLGTVHEDRFRETQRIRLEYPEEAAEWPTVVCRGPRAHLFAGTQWFSWSLQH